MNSPVTERPEPMLPRFLDGDAAGRHAICLHSIATMVGLYGGERRTLSERKCPCGKVFLAPAYRRKEYCSVACANRRHMNDTPPTGSGFKKCANCKAESPNLISLTDSPSEDTLRGVRRVLAPAGCVSTTKIRRRIESVTDRRLKPAACREPGFAARRAAT